MDMTKKVRVRSLWTAAISHRLKHLPLPLSLVMLGPSSGDHQHRRGPVPESGGRLPGDCVFDSHGLNMRVVSLGLGDQQNRYNSKGLFSFRL